MATTFLILLGLLGLLGSVYLIYRVIFGIPKDIKRTEDKIYMLELHLQDIELKLKQIDKKLDNK